jgi:hypothetical protein
MKYKVRVTEYYVADYEIEAEDENEACEKAEEMAMDDDTLAAPENMSNREVEVVGDND